MSNRRSFLKMIGTGMAAATANPVIAGISKMKSPKQSLRIGVLSPQSNLCPQYPYSFMNGLRQGIDQHNALKKQHVEIINEANGYGTPFISKQNARKLLFENNVDILVGILSNEVTEQFEDLFLKKQVPFIVCNAGEYFPVKTLRNNPYLIFNTLNFYQSAYMTGQYGSKLYGPKGFIVTSLYDCGYDATYAFYQGVESAHGKVEETLVMKINEKDFADKAIARIRETQPDFVYLMLSGDPAREFVLRYRDDSQNTVPLLTTPFVTENSTLSMVGNFANGLESISPWDKKLSNRANTEFCRQYMKTYRTEPDMFAVLGFETGLMIYQALVACDGDFERQNLLNRLNQTSFLSPRGNFSIDQLTGWTQAPLYQLRISADLFSRACDTNVIGEVEPINALHPDFSALDNSTRSGWFNPYMFI